MLGNLSDVALNKANNLVVIGSRLITKTTALNHLESIKGDLNRFYPHAINGSRKYQRVLFEVVLVGEYAMVH